MLYFDFKLATNFLLIESLQRFHQYYGDDLQVECPTGSGELMNLAGVAEEIQHRIIHLFARDVEGRRATNGGIDKFDLDPHFRDYLQFYEVRTFLFLPSRSISTVLQFFHADNGRGLGASHQTGWTGLVAFHIMQSGVTCRLPRTPKSERCSLRILFLPTNNLIAPRSLAKHYFDVSRAVSFPPGYLS